MEHVDVLVVGGGSAGLSISHELASLGIDHVVLERGRIGQTWRDRWESFCLVTPNWSVRLPGGAYAGDDPDGFMPRDEIVAHLERYAATSGAPVREGVVVRTIDRAPGGFVARTSAGDVAATRVVLATGAFQRAHRPAGSDALPAGRYAVILHTGDYSTVVTAHSALIDWAAQNGVRWQQHDDGNEERWGARVEFYITDPGEEPDASKWETEVAFLLAE